MVKLIFQILRNSIIFLSAYLLISSFGNNFTTVNFIVLLLIYLISILPYYLFNDHSDRIEDQKHNKPNLYLLINNETVFWTLILSSLMLGLSLSLKISSEALLLLIALYSLNFLWSSKWLKLRDISFLREIAVFAIYVIKLLFIASLFRYPLTLIPLPVLIMASSFAVVVLSLYKKYLRKLQLLNKVFIGIFILAWIISLGTNFIVALLIFPLTPMLIFILIKYKDTPIPINKLQAMYGCYVIAVLLASHYL